MPGTRSPAGLCSPTSCTGGKRGRHGWAFGEHGALNLDFVEEQLNPLAEFLVGDFSSVAIILHLLEKFLLHLIDLGLAKRRRQADSTPTAFVLIAS